MLNLKRQVVNVEEELNVQEEQKALTATYNGSRSENREASY